MFTQPWLQVDFGPTKASLATVGFRLFKADGTDAAARTTAGVSEIGNGAYGVAAVVIPDDAAGIEWDTGEGSPVYSVENLHLYRKIDSIKPAARFVELQVELARRELTIEITRRRQIAVEIDCRS